MTSNDLGGYSWGVSALLHDLDMFSGQKQKNKRGNGNMQGLFQGSLESSLFTPHWSKQVTWLNSAARSEPGKTSRSHFTRRGYSVGVDSGELMEPLSRRHLTCVPVCKLSSRGDPWALLLTVTEHLMDGASHSWNLLLPNRHAAPGTQLWPHFPMDTS